MFDVITIGSATRDIFLLSKGFQVHHHQDTPTGEEQCFPLGAKIEVDQIYFETGGGGTNAAVTFARFGLKVAFCGKVGGDFAGGEIKRILEKEGISTELLILDPKVRTDYSTILITPDGSRTVLIYRSSSKDFSEADISLADLTTSWLYITSVAGDFGILEKVINYAIENGIKVAINPGSKELDHRERLAHLLKKVEVVILNREEASDFCDIPFSKEHEIWNAMCGAYGQIVVITDAFHGAIACDGEKILRVGILPAPVVDRTGAGDAFGSGFVAGLIKNGDVEHSLKLGLTNATSVIQYIGAKEGIIDLSHPIPEIVVSREKL